MSYAIVEASPQAKVKVETKTDVFGVQPSSHHRAKYPLSELGLGQCFTVPFADLNEVALRSSVSLFAKKTGKRFTVLKHTNLKLVEVARIY
jgi:hypothetical protein